MYIDIHTHNSSLEEDVLKIQNVYLSDEVLSESYFSVGLHPWHIPDNKLDVTDVFNSLVERDKLLAIGEIGLDKNIEISILDQLVFLHEQFIVSEQNNLPVILHIVKAFNEIIEFKSKWCYSQPMIIHGFNKKVELAKQLIDKGFYLSFGASVMKEKSNSIEVLRSIDVSKIFIETDDQTEYGIKEIYEKIAEIIELPLEELKAQIEQNFKKIFTRYNG
jgi:TatD DNase family protein